MKRKWIFLALTVLAALASGGIMIVTAQGPVGPAFTYQGQLKQSGALVNGNCDFQFGLWDSIGTQVGATQTLGSIAVTNGLFNVQLNGSSQFGMNPFNGNARYLQIAVGCPSPAGSYTSLNPREQLTAAPYAQYAVNAASAVTANSVITPTLRKYYLTSVFTYNGSQALTACAVGYHMASLWEIFYMSGLKYDTSLGYISSGDQGSGPATDVSAGWIRTGFGTSGSSVPGGGNCNAWTSNSSVFSGTVVSPIDNWNLASGVVPIMPWKAISRSCNQVAPVWCVQNLP